MANACACGCGELLPENSTRQYKRGHKSRSAEVPTGFTEAEFGAEPNEPPPFTIDDATRETPDDPEPQESKQEKPKRQVRVTASVRRDIEGKLAFGFGIMAQTWSLADPVCSMALMESGPAMAKAYTPLVCQSPDLVRWLSKGGSFLLWMDALMTTWPLIQVIFAHHIAKTISAMPSPNGAPVSPDMYTVQ